LNSRDAGPVTPTRSVSEIQRTSAAALKPTGYWASNSVKASSHRAAICGAHPAGFAIHHSGCRACGLDRRCPSNRLGFRLFHTNLPSRRDRKRPSPN